MSLKAKFDFRGKRAEGEVIKENKKTVWVRFEVKDKEEGNKTIEVKRHRTKHNVEVLR